MSGMAPEAVAYVRVSSEEQVRGGVSLDAQEDRIRSYCAMTGLLLVSVIREEGVSGGKLLRDRPGGGELIQSLRRHRHVVALKLDRLFRDAVDALNQTREWDKKGISCHLVDMGGLAIDTSSAMGRLFLTMLAGMAE